LYVPYYMSQAAAVAMPCARVPLSINIHKLMAPQQGLGGILELPIRVAGLPITAAATGGRMIYKNLAGALGVGSARKGPGSKENDHYNDVLDETGWLGPSEEYWEEQGVYGRDAAAKGELAAGDDGSSSSSSSSVGGSDAAAAAGVDGTAVLLPSSDPAVAAALNSAGVSSSSSVASPFGQGQALKVTLPAGSSSSSSRPAHVRRLSDNAAPRASGMSRLSSQSAPLTGYPQSSSHPADSSSSKQAGQTAGQTAGQAAAAHAAAPPDTPEVRGPSPGPGKPAVGTLQQEQQQQQKEKEAKDKEQKEQLQAMQGTATGKDVKSLEGTQIKPVRRWVPLSRVC
jgi:hypothetical protein